MTTYIDPDAFSAYCANRVPARAAFRLDDMVLEHPYHDLTANLRTAVFLPAHSGA